MKKVLLSLALTFSTMLSTVWAYDFSVVVSSGHTLYFNITSNSGSYTAEVTYPGSETYGNYYSGYTKPIGNLIIPSSVTYNGNTYSVTNIGDYAFYDCSSLSSVNIPNLITSIGYSAFDGCADLTSVIIPNSVTSIDDSAFSHCSNLSSITIPNSVTYIGRKAFKNCRSLTSLTIPNNVTYIGEEAFSECRNLTTLNFNAIDCEYNFLVSEYDTSRRHPFYNCSISTINIGNSVQNMPSGFAHGFDSLTSIIIPNNITMIRDSAFAYCRNLTSITIPNSVTSIGREAFKNCRSLTSLTIPNNVITIGEEAFYNCTSLASINIPNSVSSIDAYAFYDCRMSLVNIPNSVSSIGYNAFYGTNTIVYSGAAVGAPWGANVIYGFIEGDFAYSDSTKTILRKYLGSQANVIIPNTVTTIGQSAFMGCSSIISVTIPNNVTSVEYSAFNGCSNLTTLNFNAINCSNFNNYWNYLFANCPISTINIGDSVQIIPNGFAYNLSSLTSITIPNSVTYIGDYAFYNCNSLNAVTIPNNVTTVGNESFRNCSNLASINISDSVNYIGQNVFSGTAYYENPANWENNLLYLNNWLISARTSSAGEYIIKDSTRGIAYNIFQNYIVRTIKSESLTPPIICNGSNGLGINNTFTVNVSCQALSAYLADPDWLALNVQAIPYDVNLSVNDSIMGNVNLVTNTCSSTMIQALPNIGYTFKQWNDGNTQNPRLVNLTYDTAFVAIFEARKILSVSSVNESMGTTIGGGEYELNSSATVAAVPNNGYRFTNWNNNSTINPYTFTVTRDTNLVAYFEEIIPDTAFVHDTTYVPVHDTTYINVPVHDTTIITQIDTVTVTNTVFDTVINTVYDTTYVPIHDTTYITQIDTVTNTVYDTITNTVYDTITNTVHDTVTNTVYDTITNTVYDTIDNFIYDTVYISETDTLWLYDTIYVYDTIYIHDTIYITDSTTGIENVSMINAKIYSSHSRIVVEGADGNNVMLFDMQGRLLSTKRDEYSVLEFEVPISGAYFVKIGNYKAKKVVVIK